MTDITILYNSLFNEVVHITSKLTAKQKKIMIDRIENMDAHGHEIIYAIIKYHSNKESNKDTYDMVTEKKQENIVNITWDLKNFGVTLSHMIFIFSKREEQRQVENNS